MILFPCNYLIATEPTYKNISEPRHGADQTSCTGSSWWLLYPVMARISTSESSVAGKKQPGLMRPPPIVRPLSKRPQPNVASSAINGRTRSGTMSPTGSSISRITRSRSQTPSVQNVGVKRKDRELEPDSTEGTNIHVVVRCRGRSEREIKENSGVVLSTDGVKGKTVNLSMGSTAMSNKTYHFDSVFSPAADQSMISEEVITPILDGVRLP